MGVRRMLYRGARGLLAGVISLLLLSMAVFFISRLAPGDPLVSYYGDRAEKMSTQAREQARDRLGLNDPIPMQYLRWLERATQGEFGISYQYKQDVTQVIAARLGNTLILCGAGFLLIFLLALLLGVLCAWHEDGLSDRLVCRMGTLSSCIPEFWLCLVLILIFSVQLGLLPSSGAYTVGKGKDVYDRLLHLILPLSVVVISHLWYYAYLLRNKLLEQVRCDYVLLARAKGVGRGRILLRHCLPNAMPTYLSIMAIALPHILGGAYVVETVFSYPGIGTLAYDSARYQDYNLLMVLCLLTGALVIGCGMLSRSINRWIDPRMSAPDRDERGRVRHDG